MPENEGKNSAMTEERADEKRELPPEGWMFVGNYFPEGNKYRRSDTGSLGINSSGICGLLGKSRDWVVSKIEYVSKSNPELKAAEYLNERGVFLSYYPPELIRELQHISESEKKPPEGWMHVGDYSQDKKTGEVKVASGIGGILHKGNGWLKSKIQQILKTHPEWKAVEYLDKLDRLTPHYPPELIRELQHISESEKKPPEGWMVIGDYSQDKKTGDVKIKFGICGLFEKSKSWVKKRIEELEKMHPEWKSVEYLSKTNVKLPHYQPELITELQRIVESEKEPPEGWMVVGDYSQDKKIGEIRRSFGIAGILRRSSSWIFPRIEELIRKNSNFKPIQYLANNRQAALYYPPELVAELQKVAEEEREPPEGWTVVGEYLQEGKTKSSGIAGIAKRSAIWVNARIEALLLLHPEWQSLDFLSKNNQVVPHYPPDIVYEIQKMAAEEKQTGVSLEKQKQEEEQFKKFINEISEDKTEISKKFHTLLGLFGSSRAIDLLYKFRPEFKGISVEYVKSCIAEYLGDFLSAKHEFNLKNIGSATEFLSDLTFRQGLYETLKDHCLRYYFEQKRNGSHQDGYAIIDAYLDYIIAEVDVASNEFLDDVIQDVVIYFDSALRFFHKPERFVDKLSEDREFPDLNQKINMKELADKKRMLIADEMGLGKSASVIMAKEQLGVGCALVVAPSNVIDTWINYLSDDPEKKGYFRAGEAPRVLVVNDLKRLDGISKSEYDYILISQERMNDSYAEALKNIDPDMMIVDEIHKMKTLKGKRTQAFMPLAEQMQGENKYLALLSGTPAPNKVKDIALILKMLYPQRFSDVSDRQLVNNIIHGDIIDLRSLLVPHMQMKSLEEGVEMPKMTEIIIDVELSRVEQDIYEVLLEEDELSATEKMKILRQFLLNPDILDSTPGVESAKIGALEKELEHAFKTKTKVAVFVNDYVNGVIRGDKTILEKINLPEGVEALIIEGETDKKERVRIQDAFNNSDKKILLMISGSTADVGVSFVGGEEVIFYNEPWTEAQRRQELARVYRPGLTHPIEVKTLIVKRTIEEGIHEYIRRKHLAVEKVLKGIPTTELEKELLRQNEKTSDDDSKLDVNPELAKYYFSSWDKLLQMYGHVKEIGEEQFRVFLEKWGKDYAEAYKDLGSRSYQANTNRVAGSLIVAMAEQINQDFSSLEILDIASGPEMLKRHISDACQDAVSSMDINPEHFDETPGKKFVGSWTETPFEDNSFDYINLAMSFHYSSFRPSKGNLERIDVLREMNRVLKVGGRAVISMIWSLKMRDREKFNAFIKAAGFQIVGDFSGTAESGENFRSEIVTLEKVSHVDKTARDILTEVGTEHNAGMKFDKEEKKIRDQRKIVNAFTLNGKGFAIELNSDDQQIYHEEQKVLSEGNALKKRFGGIDKIPAEEIIGHNFSRLLAGKKYILFKRLTSSPGVVLVR